ncbi:MAG: 50S ribosomal protein L34e [Candidatus Woesearchaeota archaeon]
MVSGKHKNHTFARRFVRTPGARTVLTHQLRKPGRAVCPVTGQYLHGIAHVRPAKLRAMPKTKRRPQRPFGGVLSSSAARRELQFKAREL